MLMKVKVENEIITEIESDGSSLYISPLMPSISTKPLCMAVDLKESNRLQ